VSSAPPPPSLGFVGLGAMGARMAARLLDAGYPLTIHDARPDAAQALQARGARVADTPCAVADAAEIVFVSLPTPADVRAVAVGEHGLCGGASMRCYVDLSTTGPSVAEQVAAALGEAGVACVDAPVSGAPAGAEAGTLTIMVAGAAEALAIVRPILDHLAKVVFVAGDRPGQGQVVKVINNLLSAAAIAITAEAATLGVRAGIAPETLLEVIGRSSGSNTAVLDKFPRQVLTRRFDHGFRLALMTKDVGLCLAEARRLDVPMLLGGTVEQLWNLGAREAPADADCTAIVRMFEDWAGTTIVSASA
jgi:3-hydroxyisobutyrate dehydrogenase-like beta-hydroxyacid dehydrogenase